MSTQTPRLRKPRRARGSQRARRGGNGRRARGRRGEQVTQEGRDDSSEEAMSEEGEGAPSQVRPGFSWEPAPGARGLFGLGRGPRRTVERIPRGRVTGDSGGRQSTRDEEKSEDENSLPEIEDISENIWRRSQSTMKMFFNKSGNTLRMRNQADEAKSTSVAKKSKGYVPEEKDEDDEIVEVGLDEESDEESDE